MYDILELNKKLLAELREIAKELKIKRVESFRKQELVYKILDTQAIIASETKASKKKEKEATLKEKDAAKKKSNDEKTPVTTEKKRRGRPARTEKAEATPANLERKDEAPRKAPQKQQAHLAEDPAAHTLIGGEGFGDISESAPFVKVEVPVHLL